MTTKNIMLGLLSCCLMAGFYFGLNKLMQNKKFTSYFADSYGTQPVEKKYQELIYAIKDELGITKPIEIRNMNATAIATLGRWNLLAYLDSYIFIGPDFFTEFTPKEQRFLIGHELIHIKYSHVFKRFVSLAFSFLIAVLLTILIGFYLRKVIQKRFLRLISYVMVYFLISNINGFLVLAYYRNQEYQADRDSSCALQSKQAGIDWFKRQLNYVSPIQVQEHPKTIWGQLRSTHPSHQDRIVYLETL